MLSNLSGTLVAVVVGFFLIPFVVHRIGLTAFGIWVLVNSLTGYMGLLDLGLSQTLVKKSAELLAKQGKEELNKTTSTVFTLYFLIGTLVGISILGLGLLLPHIFNVSPEYINIFKIVFWIVGLQTAISFPMSIWQGLLGGLQDFHIINGIAVITNLLKAVATVLLLTFGFGLISLIWLNFGLSIVGWLIGMFWVKRKIPYLHIKATWFEWGKVKDLARFSGVMFIWGIANKVIFSSDRIIIGLFLPVASISIYEVGARISEYSRYVLYSIFPIMPATSELSARNEKERLQNLYINMSKYLLVTYTAVVGTLLLFGKEFIHLWMGKQFEESVWIMYALIIGSLYQSQNVVGHTMLTGMNKLRVFAKVMIIYPIVNIILNVIFVIQWGLIGVALSTMLTFILIETFFTLYITKVFEIKLLSLLRACHFSAAVSVVPAIMTSHCLSIFLNFDSWAKLLLGVSVFLSIYFVSFLILGTSREEKIFLKSKAFSYNFSKNISDHQQ